MDVSKRLATTLAIIMLSSCSAAGNQDHTEADTSFSDPEPDPFDFKSWRGCEGSALDACITQVSKTLKVDNMQIAYLRNLKPQFDVNGRLLEASSSTSISGRSRGSYGAGTFFSGQLNFYFHVDPRGYCQRCTHYTSTDA